MGPASPPLPRRSRAHPPPPGRSRPTPVGPPQLSPRPPFPGTPTSPSISLWGPQAARPRSPKDSINGFSFSAYAAVTNPNRAAFSHYDSSIRLLTGGAQVGFMYIPAGEIAGGRTQFMEATFSVGSFPISASVAGIATVELDSRVELKGRVRVLKIFVHRVTVVTECRISTFSVGSFPISASAVGRAGGRNGGGGGRGGRQGGTGFIVRFFWSGLVLMGRGLSLTCQLSDAYLACQLSTLTVHVSS